MSDGYPAERLQLMPEVPRQLAALQRFGAVDLDPTIAHLVEMPASQIDCCAFCLDMHWKDARGALALAEAATRAEPGRYQPGDFGKAPEPAGAEAR